jgi:hypothetical protein
MRVKMNAILPLNARETNGRFPPPTRMELTQLKTPSLIPPGWIA